VITYPPFTTIRFDISFRRTSDGTLADPTDVQFHTQFEKEAVVNYSYSLAQVQRSGVGEYYIDFTPDREGQWRYAWQGTGDVQASTLDTIFRVMQTDLIP
jgi:hypothetical protein